MMGQILFGLLNRGVIAVPCGRYHNVVRFMPPLTITREYLEKATDILLRICREL
jgi:4-aminobutyrate aminotransferase